MATANNHKVLLTFPQRTGDEALNASDTTSGKVWLYDRHDRPVSSSATVAGPEGASITLGAGALIQEWSSSTINTDHTVNGNSIAGFVTDSLWANVGTTTVPSDHILVDGYDGSYYVAEVAYAPSAGRVRVARFEFQLSASVDYATNGDTVTIDAVEVVLVDVLSEKTFGTGDVEAMVAALIASTTGNQTVTSGSGVPSSTPASVGDVYIDTLNDIAYVATGTSSSADWDQATGAGGGGGISNVVEDVTPQLGGDLDLNGNVITGMVIGTDVQAWAAALDAVTGTNTGDEAAASTTVAGVVELLTTAELDTGTDTTRAATAAAIEASARSVKVDGIETAATADQSGAEIKAAYEAEADTNAFDDAAVAKLAAIETSATADQSGAEIKAAYEAEADTNAFDDAAVAKLAAIEASATADQSAAEILAALLTVDGSGTLLDADLVDGNEAAALLARANHTGTQASSTISDLATVVKAYRLDEFANPTADLDLADQGLLQVGAIESEVDVIASGGTAQALDLSAHNVFDITLDNGATCAITFTNPAASGEMSWALLIIRQDGTGGRAFSLPAATDWPAATAPTFSTGASEVDSILILTVDGGTTLLAFEGGLAFA